MGGDISGERDRRLPSNAREQELFSSREAERSGGVSAGDRLVAGAGSSSGIYGKQERWFMSQIEGDSDIIKSSIHEAEEWAASVIRGKGINGKRYDC